MAGRALKIDPKKAITREREQPVKQTLDTNLIAARAYELWIDRGCPIGSEQEDWFKAERELRAGGDLETA